MNTNEILKKVKKIEIKTKGLSNHIFAGEYNTAFKGSGMTFSEVRGYQQGDDIRSIDWNVTARYNSPFVKLFEEEREMTVFLLIDISASNNFGSVSQFKNELIAEISAILAFSAIKNNDKVGVMFFTDIVEKYIPPKKGKKHILRIIRELINFKPKGVKTDIANACEYLNNVIKKKSIVFLLSDFIDNNFAQSLSLVSKKHDLSGIRVFDNLEQNLHSLGLGLFWDPENKDYNLIDTSDKLVNDSIQSFYNEKYKYFRDSFLKTGSSVVNISTSDSYVIKLLELFKNK